MNIDELEAGPELDKMIAAKVFGLKWCTFRGTGMIENRDGTISEFCLSCGDPYGYHQGRPAYSTSIGAAWQVVENMKGSFNWLENADIGYCACFAKTNQFSVTAEGDTAPLAICRAVLKAIEI